MHTLLVPMTVPQDDVIAAHDQAEYLGDSISNHLEPLVKNVSVQVHILLMMLQLK